MKVERRKLHIFTTEGKNHALVNHNHDRKWMENYEMPSHIYKIKGPIMRQKVNNEIKKTIITLRMKKEVIMTFHLNFYWSISTCVNYKCHNYDFTVSYF